MRVVTVARKPCAESSTTANVVEHEAGALNIDACRVGSVDPFGGGTKMSSSGHTVGKFPEPYEQGSGWVAGSSLGRWPANVILRHRPGCKIVGTRKVSSGTAHREKSGGRTIFSETEKPAMDDMTYAGADGKETIPDWSCEPGCPVAELDRQSGTLTSGSGTVKRASSASRGGNTSATYGAESRADGEPQVWYGDAGGASRFFKAVGGEGSEG